jgi:hypothetical protein
MDAKTVISICQHLLELGYVDAVKEILAKAKTQVEVK